MELKSMKATKSQIYDFVRSAKRSENLDPNWESMIEDIAWPRNTFWHVKLACESAGLILSCRGGRHVKIELTRDGERLHIALKKSEEEADDVLGGILLSLDRRGWGITETLVSLADAPEGIVPIKILRDALRKKGIELSQTTLVDLLNLLRELEIVKFKETNSVRLVMRRYERILGRKLFREPSDRRFFSAVSAAYRLSLPSVHGSRYVPIPAIKRIVCKRSNLDIPEYVFDDKLERLPLKIGGKRIDFSPPMERRSGGIKRGRDYLYYLAIYD
jgi:hypothetical protein